MSFKDVFGEATTERLLDAGATILARLKKIGLPEIRPWEDFFSDFKPPKRWTRCDVEKRVESNFFEYKSNYAIAVAVIFLFMLFTSPILLFILLVCVGIWVYVMVIKAGEMVEFQGHSLDEGKKVAACAVASLLLLVFTGQFLKLLGTLSLALILVAAHLVFKPRRAQSKFNRLSDEMGSEGAPKRGGYLLGSRAGRRKGDKDHQEEDVEGGEANPEGNGGGPTSTSGYSTNLKQHSNPPRQRPNRSEI